MNLDMSRLLVLAGAFVFCAGLTWVMLKNASRLQLVQVPNARSSHRHPTPSGGGAAVAATSLAAGLLLLPEGGYAFLCVAVCSSAALLGFLDDRYDLSSSLRFGFHLIFVGVIAFFLYFGEAQASLVGWIVLFGLVVTGVWWINLFNFMDGIDGLAGSQAVFMSLAGVTLACAGQGWQLDWMGWWSLAIAASVLGFLTLNWPPAKIFLGDAGSNFLAIALLALFLWFHHAGLVAAPPLLLIAALFTSDATVTLLRRMISGERWWSAHRQHAYQRLARAWGRHGSVTALYLAINVVWLYPCAYIAAGMPDIAWIIVAVGYLPVVVFSIAVAPEQFAS